MYDYDTSERPAATTQWVYVLRKAPLKLLLLLILLRGVDIKSVTSSCNKM